MNFVHEGVGEKRVESFNLDDFVALYPEDRIKLNQQAVLAQTLESVASEHLMFSKTRALQDLDVVGRIVERLESPNMEELTRLYEEGLLTRNLSYQDIASLNYLDPGKHGVFNTTVLSDRLINIFSSSVLEKNDLEIAFTVDNAIELMDSTMWSIMDATTEDKGEFILYNTVSFLMDEGMASMEEITKTVMLSESNVGSRVATAFATAPEYNL